MWNTPSVFFPVHPGVEGRGGWLAGSLLLRLAPLVMLIHDVLVPFRFLALVGHFLAALLALYAVVRAARVVRLCFFSHFHICRSPWWVHARSATM